MTPQPLPNLSQLSGEEKDALIRAQAEQIRAQAEQIRAQAEQIAVLTARLCELEAKLNQPPKTPDNSSLPPSKGEKANRAGRRGKGRRKGRPGVSRTLAEHPDRTVEAYAESCPHCRHALTAADQPDAHAYDHVDLPPIKPVVTRINRHRGVCPCCRRGFSAAAPAGLAPGSPFGPNLCALVVHLHVTQAVSFERLVRLLSEVFGVAISEGAVANILARAEPALSREAERIAETVRRSPVIASDETSARVCGRTWWQWVLMSSTAVYHVIADTRSARVVTDVLQGARPQVWVADRYAGQAGHGDCRQLCLAHLLRDAQYAVDDGDGVFAPGFKALLLRAVAIGRRRSELKDTTLKHYRADLDRRLDRLLVRMPTARAARTLWRAMRRHRADLFRFVTRRDVPYTNNACERALRPSVIFRKVTGCFRSTTGAKLYAAAVSVIATGRLAGKSALQAITDALAPAAPALTRG